jgi:Flagellar capping protein
MSGISLSGLASGLDTSAMIEALMKLEKIPYTSLETKKTTITNNQTLIRNLNTKVLALRTTATELMYSTAFKQSSAISSDTTSVNVTASETATPGSYSVQVSKLAQKHVVASAEFAAGDSSTLSGTFTLKGKDGTVSKDIDILTGAGVTNQKMLEKLRDDINSAKAGTTASIIETSPGNLTLVLTADNFGENSDIRIGAGASGSHVYLGGDSSALTLLENLGVKQGGTNATNTKQAAQNAEATVNGIAITSGSNTLKDVVPGLTIDLLKAGSSSTITVDKDATKVASKVQAFVDAYNDAVTLIRESSAKGAVMQGDSTLRMLQQELSDLVNGTIGGKYGDKNADYAGAFSMLSEIGLEIDKGITSGSQMTGKISFDKDKFIEAFKNDSDSVYQLFAYDGSEGNKDGGIAVRMYQSLGAWTKSNTGFLAYKLSGYDSDIKMITEQMDSMNLRLKSKEAKLQAQFAAMESALSSLNNQQSWLNSQIASLSYNN